MKQRVVWWERHQVLLYFGGLLLGAITGLVWPLVARPAELTVFPVLALLLYATFLGIPLRRLGRAFQDWRFLSALAVVNFLVVPLLVWPLSRIVAHDQVLLVGVLFVLLAPCIDYVIVFAGLAGGDEQKLLAAAPLLMLAQILLLPAFLWLFLGAEFVAVIDFGPFFEAFALLIVLPLAAAALTQILAGRSCIALKLERGVSGAMVPLMTVTLFVVVASQIAGVSGQLSSLLLPILVMSAFAVIMVPLGVLIGRVARLDVPTQRSLVFSGVTRNSLVVLPLVLALPPAFSLAPLVVVTQTLVELVVMVILVRLVPRLLPDNNKHF